MIAVPAQALPPPPPSAAVAAPPRAPGIAVTPERLFLLAEQLAAAGRTQAAIPLLKALAGNVDPDYRAEARARLARLYRALGDDRAAAAWFQKLLDEKPDAAAVRVELADVLLRLGDAGAASRQLRRAAAARALPAAVARALGQAGAVLRNDAPVQLSAQIGIAPDSNINRATQARQVDIAGLPFVLDGDARAKSGIGLTLGGEAVLQHRIGPRARLVADLSGAATLYRRAAFDDVAATASLGPEWFRGSLSWRPALVVGARWYGGRRLYDIRGLSTVVGLPAGKAAQLSVTLTGLRFDYPARPDLSGPFAAASIAYERALGPRSLIRIELGGSRVAASDPAQATSSVAASVTGSRDVGRIIVFARLGGGRTRGDAIFPGLGVARDDLLAEGEVGIVYKRLSLWGLSPLVKARHVENHSPVVFYDYRQDRVEFALTKTF